MLYKHEIANSYYTLCLGERTLEERNNVRQQVAPGTISCSIPPSVTVRVLVRIHTRENANLFPNLDGKIRGVPDAAWERSTMSMSYCSVRWFIKQEILLKCVSASQTIPTTKTTQQKTVEQLSIRPLASHFDSPVYIQCDWVQRGQILNHVTYFVYFRFDFSFLDLVNFRQELNRI